MRNRTTGTGFYTLQRLARPLPRPIEADDADQVKVSEAMIVARYVTKPSRVSSELVVFVVLRCTAGH